MLCVDSSRLYTSGLSLCDLCLCYSIFGSQFSYKYLLTYLLTYVCTSVTKLYNIVAANEDDFFGWESNCGPAEK